MKNTISSLKQPIQCGYFDEKSKNVQELMNYHSDGKCDIDINFPAFEQMWCHHYKFKCQYSK